MNNLQQGNEGYSSVGVDSLSDNSLFAGQEQGLRPMVAGAKVSEEEKGYLATCEETYLLATSVVSFQMMNANEFFSF